MSSEVGRKKKKHFKAKYFKGINVENLGLKRHILLLFQNFSICKNGETEGGDDSGPVHQGGDQQHGHDGEAVLLQCPGDQGVAAQSVQLSVPGLGPTHPGGGHLVIIFR